MFARYRYRIEPTTAQREALARQFGCCRVVFNDAIRVRESLRGEGRRLSDSEIQTRVIALAKKTSEREWLAEVSSDALIQSVRDCHRAYRNFFDGLAGRRKGGRAGKPRFKSRKDTRQSFRLTRNGFKLRENGRLFLAKVGDVRVRWSRALPSEPSSVTIIREPDGNFFASFVVERQAEPLPATDQEAGVDLGLTTFAAVAMTGGAGPRVVDVANPRFLKSKLRKLRRLEREKARRRRGSGNREKTRQRIARQHGEVARSRLDHHHKVALDLVRDNQAIYIEDLHVAGMLRNRRLARAIDDAAWAQFGRVLAEKAEYRGRVVHRIDRWHPSSRLCADCGRGSGAKPLEVRVWTCEGCGAVHQRDHVAARNILAAGRAERENACGHHVRPPSGQAVVDEAGTAPGSA
ncbi:RNA-guided endonuclease InsQ/TnpB family protein [Umezawaea endophytica]|uniref:Transposase n=1 Tax=Umezawaea endophytica TaxID=1654476 RepID=A0A9X2VNS4_9PSEU|nr:transposase [Umezawaea endophytica]MCS7479809.1 transposase [Umezawaea endophytica]